jgi:hypothetical protein
MECSSCQEELSSCSRICLRGKDGLIICPGCAVKLSKKQSLVLTILDPQPYFTALYNQAVSQLQKLGAQPAREQLEGLRACHDTDLAAFMSSIEASIRMVGPSIASQLAAEGSSSRAAAAQEAGGAAEVGGMGRGPRQ